MFQHILVPLDGSHLAETAVPAALELAVRFESKITLLRVVRPPYMALTSGDGAAYADLCTRLRTQYEEEARMYLRSLQGSLRGQGYNVHIHLTTGEPIADLILEVADGLDIDGIVMSTHGRGGISRWVNGSVAEKVLRGSFVPVLLIRATEATTNWHQPASSYTHVS